MQTPSIYRAFGYTLSIVSCLFVSAVGSFAQIPTKHSAIVFSLVEHQPEFPGGFSALKEYMQTNVHYPPEAQKAGIKGQVFVSFVVEIDSSLTNVQILKGIGYGCDEEAIRVISAMPRWVPGSQSGQLQRVRYNLPVLFGVDYPTVRFR